MNTLKPPVSSLQGYTFEGTAGQSGCNSSNSNDKQRNPQPHLEATGNQYDVVGFLHLCCCCTLGFAATCGIVKSLTHFSFWLCCLAVSCRRKVKKKKKTNSIYFDHYIFNFHSSQYLRDYEGDGTDGAYSSHGRGSSDNFMRSRWWIQTPSPLIVWSGDASIVCRKGRRVFA